jgi:hypothetical protein
MTLSLLRLSDVCAQIRQRRDLAIFCAKLKSKPFADGTGWGGGRENLNRLFWPEQ